MITTTLNELASYVPCDEGVDRIAKFWSRQFGKTEPDDEPFALSLIMDAFGGDNRVYHACWCFRILDQDNWFRIGLFAVDCAAANRDAYVAFFSDEVFDHAVTAIRYYVLGRFSDAELDTYANSMYTAAAEATAAGQPEAADAARSVWKAAEWAKARTIEELDKAWHSGMCEGTLESQIAVFKQHFDTPQPRQYHLDKLGLMG